MRGLQRCKKNAISELIVCIPEVPTKMGDGILDECFLNF